jgi:hypothetical protein
MRKNGNSALKTVQRAKSGESIAQLPGVVGVFSGAGKNDIFREAYTNDGFPGLYLKSKRCHAAGDYYSVHRFQLLFLIF